MDKRLLLVILLTGFLVHSPVIAEEASTPGRRPLPVAPRVRDGMEAVREKREKVRTNGRERWQELKENRETKREGIKENMQAGRAQIKANIKNVGDERKKLVVENVQKKLADINARRTEHFTNVLARLSTILDKIQSRTEKAKTEGKNVSAIETAIAEARTAIASLEFAVNAQKQKTYQITVSDENTAKAEVGKTVKQMHADLQAVADTIQDARMVVVKVFEQIKSVTGVSPTIPPAP